MRFWQNEHEDMDFRHKLGQRRKRLRLLIALICWMRHQHAWKSIQLQNVETKDGEKFKWIDTAICKICTVFYHEWW